MKKTNKKHSSAIAQGMYVLSVLMFILVAMMFGSCSNPRERSNEGDFRYEANFQKRRIAPSNYIITYEFEGRRHTIWYNTEIKDSQLTHIENLTEEE